MLAIVFTNFVVLVVADNAFWNLYLTIDLFCDFIKIFIDSA